MSACGSYVFGVSNDETEEIVIRRPASRRTENRDALKYVPIPTKI